MISSATIYAPIPTDMLSAYEGDDVLERMIERVVCWIIDSNNCVEDEPAKADSLSAGR